VASQAKDVTGFCLGFFVAGLFLVFSLARIWHGWQGLRKSRQGKVMNLLDVLFSVPLLLMALFMLLTLIWYLVC
jgi:hypothetical protein